MGYVIVLMILIVETIFMAVLVWATPQWGPVIWLVVHGGIALVGSIYPLFIENPPPERRKYDRF